MKRRAWLLLVVLLGLWPSVLGNDDTADEPRAGSLADEGKPDTDPAADPPDATASQETGTLHDAKVAAMVHNPPQWARNGADGRPSAVSPEQVRSAADGSGGTRKKPAPREPEPAPSEPPVGRAHATEPVPTPHDSTESEQRARTWYDPYIEPVAQAYRDAVSAVRDASAGALEEAKEYTASFQARITSGENFSQEKLLTKAQEALHHSWVAVCLWAEVLGELVMGVVDMAVWVWPYVQPVVVQAYSHAVNLDPLTKMIVAATLAVLMLLYFFYRLCKKYRVIQRTRTRASATQNWIHDRYKDLVSVIERQSRVAARAFPHLLLVAVFGGLEYLVPQFMDETARGDFVSVVGLMFPIQRSWSAEYFSNSRIPNERKAGKRNVIYWLRYWVVFGFFQLVGSIPVVSGYFDMVPYYYNVRLFVVFWLTFPWTNGQQVVYKYMVVPLVSRYIQKLPTPDDGKKQGSKWAGVLSVFRYLPMVSESSVGKYLPKLVEIVQDGSFQLIIFAVAMPWAYYANPALGVGYPLYASIWAIVPAQRPGASTVIKRKSDLPRDMGPARKWIRYWVIYQIFEAVHAWLSTFLSWVPFWSLAKLLAVLLLQLPVMRLYTTDLVVYRINNFIVASFGSNSRPTSPTEHSPLEHEEKVDPAPRALRREPGSLGVERREDSLRREQVKKEQ